MKPSWEFTAADFPPLAKARAIAEDVLRNWQLRGLRAVHDITAVEFYVSSPDHFDQSNHCHPLQLTAGRWYVHTAKNHLSFKSPRHSGIDLTLGTAPDIYAAMLIRQLDGDGGSGKAIMKLIRGPGVGEGSLPAGHPLLRWSEDERSILHRVQGEDVSRGVIRLVPRTVPVLGELVSKKRVGIEGKLLSDLALHFALVGTK